MGHSGLCTDEIYCLLMAALVQEHAAQAVDGLAPAGTVASLLPARFDDGQQHISPRLGVILNVASLWERPKRSGHVRDRRRTLCRDL